MSIEIEIPETLVKELWAWYAPRDKYAPKGRDQPLFSIGKCNDLQRCSRSRDAYAESYKSFRAMKDLRRMLSDLSSFIDDGIARMGKELLPVSRSYGIETLPGHVMVKIMSLVHDSLVSEPERSKEMLWTFLDLPPFGWHIHNAKELIKKWRNTFRIWDGGIPQTQRTHSITGFYFSMDNNFDLKQVQKGLGSLKALEALSISCDFRSIQINTVEGDDMERTVDMPSLERLSVSNFSQTWFYTGSRQDCALTKPLQRIICMLKLPNVRQIDAKIRVRDVEDVPIAAIFDFPSRTFPKLHTFNIESIRCTIGHTSIATKASCDLSWVVGNPSLSNMTLGSCQCVRYFDMRVYQYPTESPIAEPSLNVRNILLKWDRGHNGAVEFDKHHVWHKLCTRLTKSLEEVLVDAPNETMFQKVQTHFPSARWITDRSILDEDAHDE